MHNKGRIEIWRSCKKLFTFICSDYGNSSYEQEKQFKRSPGVSADE